jgi:hypothetical protein
MKEHTALTITYFPRTDTTGSKIYAVMLGLVENDIAEVWKKLRLEDELLFSPFTLMKIFLELEKYKRSSIVARMVDRIEGLIDDYNQIPAGADEGSSNTKADSDDPHRLLHLYLEVGLLKGGLAAWRYQLLGMKEFSQEFRVIANPRLQEIDPDDYLSRLIGDYEVLIGNCEKVILAISLAFQRVGGSAGIETRPPLKLIFHRTPPTKRR